MSQKKLRTEVIQLEDALGQVRKAYEMLRIEFEQTLAAHEQTGYYIQSTLVNSTMHNSILSLISTWRPGPSIFPCILLQFHNVYLDNG